MAKRADEQDREGRAWGYAEADLRIKQAGRNRARTLSLADLDLRRVPDSLGHFTQLLRLSLRGNELTALPESLGRMTQLRELYLSGNKLTALPESLGQMTQLRELNLSNNKLTALPESLGQMTQLRRLNLNNNNLMALPESLGQLTRLVQLDLYGNKLTVLPEALGRMTQLREIDLRFNQLIALPASLMELRALERLLLQGNPDLGLPEDVLGATPEGFGGQESKKARPGAIIDYYFRVRAGARPLNEAKLILVGRGGVGKTSVVNCLLHDRFDAGEKKTDGISISEWRLSICGRDDVRLNIWDFGGQEIMHATHQFFLTQRSLYLLVLEGRSGAEDVDAEYWLKLIDSFGGDGSGEVSPVLVVLNKSKVQPFDLNRRALQQKYPFIHGFIATDCADRTGIGELRTTIERECDRLKHLRDPFPDSWFAIKARLASMKESFITFDQYRHLCQELGETDDAGQDLLAYHLHNLGIALNYKDDVRLRDTHVLNPRWVTSGIYTLLNAPLLEKQKGELCLADAAKILDEKAYPRHMHRFLFDLMKKFDLCFTFPDDDAHYLIPELLDKQEPEDAAEFRLDECLNFEYKYPVLPEGLLPRFIVRTHALSAGLPRWRTGVVLAFEGNRGIVKADVQDKRAYISVSGPISSQRRLLAIIRSDLERIHADISNLKPEALVTVPGHPTEVVPYGDLLVMEREGERTFKKAIHGKLVAIDVQALLNGVDLQGIRNQEASMPMAVRLFYSYSHKDEPLRDELETHLKILHHTGFITAWHDRKIEPGGDWKTQIDENLERADIILLLVSADFIASVYCYEKEMKRATVRHDAGQAVMIPIIVRDCNWKLAPFARLQALPKDGKAVMEWPSKDAAWRNVSEGIERVVERIREGKL